MADQDIWSTERGVRNKIRDLASGGYFEIAEKQGRRRRRYVAIPGAGEHPEIAYFVDRERRDLDEDGRRWLGLALRQVFRRTAFGAEQRVARLLAAGGVDAVLAEISQVRGDHVQRVYFEQLMQQAEPAGEGLEPAPHG